MRSTRSAPPERRSAKEKHTDFTERQTSPKPRSTQTLQQREDLRANHRWQPRKPNPEPLPRHNTPPDYRRKQQETAPTTSTNKQIYTNRHQHNTTCLHQGKATIEEQECDPKTDLKSEEKGSRRSLQTLNNRVHPLFIQWVLISTNILCAYTYLTVLPSILHTRYSPNYPPSNPPPEIHSECSPPPILTPAYHNPSILHLTPTHYSTPPTHTPHQEAAHPDPPSKTENSPAPATPTQHTHAIVSIKTCTHHRSNTHSTITHKSQSSIPISLPSRRHCRPPPPPENDCSIQSSQSHRSLPAGAHTTRLESPAQSHYSPHNTAPTQTLSLTQIPHSRSHPPAPKTEYPRPNPKERRPPDPPPLPLAHAQRTIQHCLPQTKKRQTTLRA